MDEKLVEAICCWTQCEYDSKWFLMGNTHTLTVKSLQRDFGLIIGSHVNGSNKSWIITAVLNWPNNLCVEVLLYSHNSKYWMCPFPCWIECFTNLILFSLSPTLTFQPFARNVCFFPSFWNDEKSTFQNICQMLLSSLESALLYTYNSATFVLPITSKQSSQFLGVFVSVLCRRNGNIYTDLSDFLHKGKFNDLLLVATNGQTYRRREKYASQMKKSMRLWIFFTWNVFVSQIDEPER